MMPKLLQRFIPDGNEHLTDDRMARLFCNEMPFVERLVAKRHLAGCWFCRIRQEELEGPRADEVVSFYRAALGDDLPLPSDARAAFTRQLDQQIKLSVPRKRWAVSFPSFFLSQSPVMNPALAVCAALCFAAAVLLFTLWWQQRNPNITSNALLVRAEKWDRSNLASPGVVYEAVRITTPRQTMERSIYRDVERKRAPKPSKLAEKQEALKAELAQAGVDWDEPISASDYRKWHDRQHERVDNIVRDGTHLLKLTTTVPDSSVSAQSLTVRDTDFHPVRRTVVLRDVGTVEIAELDFKILPWSDVGEDIFEPIGGVSTHGVAVPMRTPQLPRLPQSITQEQLDESELSARLILNQLHADDGEQIEIHRLQQEVEIEGVVETDDRKRELQMQLSRVPHVTAFLQSVTDLNYKPAYGGITNVKAAVMPDQASPLELLLQSQGRNVSDMNAVAQQFFSAALIIGQESKAIVDLQTRFAQGQERTLIASATLSELIYSHRERLDAALKRERVLIAEAQVIPDMQAEAEEVHSSSLLEAAGRNLELSRELTQTNIPATRSAEQILAEMSKSIGDLASAAHDVYGKTQGVTLSGKK